VISGPNCSPNAAGIAVQNLLARFSISSSVPEIFAAELRSRPKSGQILNVLAPNFLGVASKILDGHYKTRPNADQHAKFHADRPTRLGNLMIEEKILKKTSQQKILRPLRQLSLPGGLKKYQRTKYCPVHLDRLSL